MQSICWFYNEDNVGFTARDTGKYVLLQDTSPAVNLAIFFDESPSIKVHTLGPPAEAKPQS
jgi:hypothetical protein